MSEIDEFFTNKSSFANFSEKNTSSETDPLLTEISEDLRQTDDEVPVEDWTETVAEKSSEEKAADKKRFAKLSKLGAKSIVKVVDLGNAALANKIAFGDDATIYRADPEALEDLTEVIEEIIPKKAGEALAIPLWVQLILYVAIAFLPVLFSALSDRKENKILKAEKSEKRRLKMEKKLIKMQLENKELAEKLKLQVSVEKDEENLNETENLKEDE